jgi:lon-related putative ATP-dependent protease
MRELSVEECRNFCKDFSFDCESTAELEPLREIIGQERAVRSLRFGLGIRERGFNIFASGMPGTGRKTAIVDFIKQTAKELPVPPDLCYVNNFKDPQRPRALRLPAGKGMAFRKAMERFTKEIKNALKEAFESEEYARKRSQMLKSMEEERNQLSNEISEIASEAGFQLQQSPIGLVLVPVIEGNPIDEQQLAQLPRELRERIHEKRKETQAKLQSTFRELREIERKASDLVRELNGEVASFAMEPMLSGIKEQYNHHKEVIEYLGEVEEDVLENLILFLQDRPQTQMPMQPSLPDPSEKYQVNLVVDNSGVEGAPVEIEWNPSYSRLFGVVEKEARFGALVTNYTMIRAGAAHRANGGFLVLPVERLFVDPVIWEGLKQAISTQKLEIEEPAAKWGYMATKSLIPEPVAFDTKVILLGDPMVYALLFEKDKEFKELFKVKADFDITMDRTEANTKRYASFVCTLCKKEDLLHLDPSALAALIEYSSRLVEDKEKLSTQFSEISDIIREACFYAREEGAELVTKEHIERQLEEKIFRSNLIQKKIEEMIQRGSILIETEGEKVGQVNGLAVYSSGDYAFGKPSRITASVGVGREGITDIEREAQMGGSTHTKGVMILGGYLNDRFARQKPLSLNARLVFEQSYSGVDGDSASSTELYALLSALSSRPIKQGLAVTGSVNQKGEVQAIGGVNQKIEGFFQVCKAKGLTGDQGCVIPESNVKNLMLRGEVLEAIEKGEFHIYPVITIDEGIEVLTGVEAGHKKPDGDYPEGTVNFLVQERLDRMAENIKEFRL